MKPGIHKIPMAQYLADPCPAPSLSSGIAHTLVTRSPFHAWHCHPRLNADYQDDPSDASDIGSIAHELVLEGTESKLVVIDAATWNVKCKHDGREQVAWKFRDEIRAAGKLPILAERLMDVRRMVNACREFIAGSEIAGVFDDGEPEQTMIWQEGETWCRARPDWLTSDHSLLVHYKTTQGSAEPEAWIRAQLLGQGYDMAAVFYERGLYSMPGRGKAAPTSVFLVQEAKEPYCCSLIGLSPQLSDFAERKLNKAFALWAECMKSGKWPSYPSRICYAEPPAWAERQWEERAITNEAYDPEVALEP